MDLDTVTVRINSVGHHRCAADWYWDTGPAPWSDNDLWLVLAGVGSLVARAEQRYSLGRGDCFVLPGDVLYRADHDPAQPLEVIAIHFDLTDPTGAAVSHDFQFHRRLADPGVVAALMFRAVRAEARGAGVEAAHWAKAALWELTTVDGGGVPAHDRPQVRRRVADLCDEIRAEPGRVYRVGELAQRLHCSHQHCVRLFNAVVGVGPKEYVIRARIAAAKSWLRTSNHPIKRIAELVGYRDEFFFSRQFAERVGVPPGRYRAGSTDGELVDP